MKTILLVEDDRDIREPMTELLEDEGYTVVCAPSGVEALQMLQSSKDLAPGIILCDLMMPKMNGIEFIKALRKNQMTSVAEAVVLLSAANDVEKTAHDLSVGFLRKPIDLEELLKKVHQYCN